MSRKKKIYKKKGKIIKDLTKNIFKILNTDSSKHYNYKQISAKLGVSDTDGKTQILQKLVELTGSKKIKEIDRGKFQINNDRKYHIGTLDITSNGNGYFISDDFEKDIFIPSNNLGKGLQNDTVKAYVYKRNRSNKLEADIIEIIERDKIQLVEAPDWTGITAFMKFKCPLVIKLHGSDTYFCNLENRPQKTKNFWFEKIALKKADSIVSVSKFTGVKTAKLFGLREKMTVIENGIDITKFTISDRKIIDSNIILYFGSIIRKKGVLELADIFNEIIKTNPKAILKLVGKDVKDIITNKSTKTLFLERSSIEAKKNIQFVGEVPYESIQHHVSTACVVVLPSFAEAFPMTWLEAMAMGKAMVTSNIGWASEIIDDGIEGFLVNPIDHVNFAKKIVLLLENIEMQKKIGIAAKNKVEQKFIIKICADRNIEFYKSLIEKN